MRLEEWQKDTLLCLGTCAALLGAGEVVARLAWEPGSEASVIQADPLLGWSLRPGSSMHSVDTDRGLDYRIEVNRIGLRDRERSVHKQPGRRRVLFLGDSMVFGAGVPREARCSDRLEAVLGPGVEVVNAAVGGWGVDQEYLWLTRGGLRLEPDVVVLGLCVVNDVLNDMLPHELFGTAPKPHFDLRDGQLQLIAAAARPAPPFAARLRSVLKNSRLLLYIGKHVAMLHPATPPHAPTARLGPGPFFPEDLESDSSHWSVFRVPYSPRFESAFAVTEALIAAMAESCSTRGVPLIVFAFPQKVEVDPVARTAELKHYGYDPAQFDLSAPYARLRALADRLGVPFVYPLEMFQKAQAQRALFFSHDGHPNAAGQGLAAEAVEPAVRDALDRVESLHAGTRPWRS